MTMDLWTKTKEQFARIDIIIKASESAVAIVGLIFVVVGMMERSLAVVGIGLFFLGFVAWHFYTY